AQPRGRRARRGAVGAPGAPVAALLHADRRRRDGVPAAERPRQGPARPAGRVDRGDPRGARLTVARARVTTEIEGRLREAEALWYDTSRWPTFIDGFAHLQSVEPGWPREGRLVWDSRPDGRGRVVETVARYAA